MTHEQENEKWYHLSLHAWLLMSGLVLFNIGCFASPDIVDDFFRSLDIRRCPWWYFAIFLLIAAYSIKKFSSFSSRKDVDPLKSKNAKWCPRVLTVFICGVAVILVVMRVTFDVTTYFDGTTFMEPSVQPDRYPYLLHLPPGYTDFGGSRPLIVFLHGAGETNKGLDVLQHCDLWSCARDHIPAKDFPFIVVCPVTPKHGWEPVQVKRFVEQIFQDYFTRYRIDPSRVYLTGVSMGGFGTFHTACAYPEMFAAIAPVCGGGEPEQAEKLMGVPTWAFHGDADDIVPYACSADMIEAMKKTGHVEARLTTFEGGGHGIAGEVYQNSELYRWMLMHQKRQ